MGKALYRTYRSRKLAEIVGQEHITTALSRSLKNGTIAHAYLFTGPRGVGKTSIARILAHEINDLPYDEDKTHLDIIEIDAASNRRIDEIRDLRDKVMSAPTSAKYKVYIIDEVHMLTREAFNALLKTLEEPPAHVVFVLATTETHKLPETIVSRTQRFTFKPVEQDKVVAHLTHIASQENITIEDAALALIAAHGEGSFRDSISLLDQMRNSADKITLAHVQAALGIAPLERINALISALGSGDSASIINQVHACQQQGLEPAQIARQLSQALRQALADNKSPLPAKQTLQLLTQLVEVPASHDPRLSLEIALLDATFTINEPAQSPPKPKIISAPVQAKPVVQIEQHPSTLRKSLSPQSSTGEIKKSTSTKEKTEQKDTQPTTPKTAANDIPQNEATDKTRPSPAIANNQLDDPTWQQILTAIRQKYSTLYSVLKTAQANFEPGVVSITTDKLFYKKRLSESRNKQNICSIIQEISGFDVELRCEVGEITMVADDTLTNDYPPLPTADGEVVFNVNSNAEETTKTIAAESNTSKTQKNSPNPNPLGTISDIFGGAEVLES